jgi:hypothetical protein
MLPNGGDHTAAAAAAAESLSSHASDVPLDAEAVTIHAPAESDPLLGLEQHPAPSPEETEEALMQLSLGPLNDPTSDLARMEELLEW